MADIRPFAAFRFDSRRAPLSRVLCPPYDVIGAEQAAALRSDEVNAVHLELPEGEGQEKYEAAARRWRRWRESELLVKDGRPAFYVVEERFKAEGSARVRLGFLAALSVKPGHERFVLAHERTLAKPKEDRLSLLSAVRANISPIFGLLPDTNGVVRRALKTATAAKPLAIGRMLPSVAYRLWALTQSESIQAIVGAAAARRILIADGHHRYEVSRAYYERHPVVGAETVLAYLCPEEDPGLVVLPTHRIVEVRLNGAAAALAKMENCESRAVMLKRLEAKTNPYSFGLYERGQYGVGVPKESACRSGLCVEWLGAHLLREVAPDRIRYTPDAGQAVAMAEGSGGCVVFVKPMRVAQIRKAVRAVGLLPPKSTYFYPKIATGLVFKSLE